MQLSFYVVIVKGKLFSPKNKYLYNGKELQDDDLGGVSLDWYDYGARFYDPSLGRWHVKDPLCEYSFNMTPYHYVTNDPINYIDPFGLKEKKARKHWWQFWRKPEKPSKPIYQHHLDTDITVTAKGKSNNNASNFSIWLSRWGAYSQPGGIYFTAGSGWCGVSAAHSTNGGDINHLVTLLAGGSAGGKVTQGGELNLATAFAKSGAADMEINSLKQTSDKEITKTKTGTGEKLDANGKPINTLPKRAWIAEKSGTVNKFNPKKDTYIKGDTIILERGNVPWTSDSVSYWRVQNRSRGK